MKSAVFVLLGHSLYLYRAGIVDIIDLYQIDISGPSLILSVTKGVLQKKNTLRTGVPDSIGPDP